MDVTLLYFEGCPNWRLADQRLAELAGERSDLTVSRRRVQTAEEADRLGFLGSPSIRVDEVDPFAQPDSRVGLTCRRYPNPEGSDGAPTLDQLRSALAHA